MIALGYVAFILLGLIIGSFLNVLIYRMPLIMKREWHLQSCEILKQEASLAPERLTLSLPRSHCTQCKTPLKIWHNIPLLSFILLKGRCQQCRTKIAWQYPIVELLAAIVAAVCFWRFGYSYAFGGAVILSWGLIAISTIDINEQFIPDTITLSLLWLGLLANAYSIYTNAQSAILGAIIGYAIFWSIAKLFLLIRKKEGLGYGDFKLLAMLAAWMGVISIINIILIASVTGLIISAILLARKKLQTSSTIPFGPFLAFAGWLTLIFGSFITQAILYS